MHQIQCAEIWGGIRNQDQDARSGGITASLFSSSCDGGKGGDIYYLSVCNADMLTRVAIADVVGHGEAVSDISQFIYDALKAHMNDIAGDELLAEVNQVAAERGFDAITTAAVVAFYRKDNNLYFTYAGHYPAMIKRTDQQHWFNAQGDANQNDSGGEVSNLPLAIDADTKYHQQALPLNSGDRIFLYSDGVVETPDQAGTLFGQDRLAATLAEFGSAPLVELKASVLQRVRDHAGGRLTHDDVTLLAIEVR